MVINIWRYDSTLKGVASPKLKQDLAFSTSLSRARYIFDIQLSAEDVAIMEQVRPVGDYVNTDSPQGHRIKGRHAYNMVSQDPEGRAQEIAIYGARAGLHRFWHIAVSSREGEHLTPEQLEHVRSVVCRVMGVEDCPSVWADHRDTDNDHMHGLVVSFLADEDRPVVFGQDWWKEAGQIAMAIIERDLGLEPEPNRRFVADRTGVYHTFSDIKVADENGTILGRSEIVAAQKAHMAWKRDNYAAQIENSGKEWDLERAVQVLAKPRMMKSDTAKEMHESLARVGLKYVAGQSGARIVAHGYLPGSGKDAQGQSIAAGKAYSNAALKKLGNRLKGGFKPAPPDLSVRTFVMPRFEKLTEEERDRYADRRAENEECKALTQHLEKHNADHYRRVRDAEKGASTNERRLSAAAPTRRKCRGPRRWRNPCRSLLEMLVCSPRKRATPWLSSGGRPRVGPHPTRRNKRPMRGASLKIVTGSRTPVKLAITGMVTSWPLSNACGPFRSSRRSAGCGSTPLSLHGVASSACASHRRKRFEKVLPRSQSNSVSPWRKDR